MIAISRTCCPCKKRSHAPSSARFGETNCAGAGAVGKYAPINPEAFQLWLKGRYYWYKLNPEGLQKAIEYFQQALEKDPAYAPAYAGLADSYNLLAFFQCVSPSGSDAESKGRGREGAGAR